MFSKCLVARHVVLPRTKADDVIPVFSGSCIIDGIVINGECQHKNFLADMIPCPKKTGIHAFPEALIPARRKGAICVSDEFRMSEQTNCFFQEKLRTKR